MRRRLRISFCVNDHRNGMFRGCAVGAEVESLYRVGKHPWDAELDHDDWSRGRAFTIDQQGMRIRIYRVWFPFKRYIPHFGNWCWDAFEFERATGARLLGLMRSTGEWRCTCGSSRVYSWWNKIAEVA